MKVSVAAVAALILVGCGSQDKSANEAAAGAGSPASGAQSIQPGQWEMATQMMSVDIPGAPPEVVQQMRAQQGRTQTDRTCITPEQARNPLRELRDTMSGPRGANCRKLEDTFAGGVIRIRMSCQAPSGRQGTAELSVQGSFTATTLTAAVSINAQGPNVGGPGTTAMRVSTNLRGRRIGDCPANAGPRTGPPSAPPPVIQPGNGQ
ncbi:MAG TPA: DUF3617 domain-containing protein [Allosphingosinicella sp.]|nr:DUF3617 domain-containing protein [Allosphingosinicella sp.]